MDIKYRPPLNLLEECNFLEKNMFKCLKEKSAQDNLPERRCKPEHLLWFFLECPNRSEVFETKEGLRELFIKEKLSELNPQVVKGKKK